MFDIDDFIIKDGRADKPIGYPPSGFIRKAFENLYTSIVGALDVGDFETFLKESADLTYSEAKDKMIREYGTPKELSEAMLKAKTAESEAKLGMAEQEARAEQRTLEQEFAELDDVARRRLGENLELSRRNEELEREIRRQREEFAKAKAAPPAAAPPRVPAPPVPAAPPAAHGSMYQEYRKRISEVITIADINDMAAEIFDIAEREEYSKLTKGDISELLDDLRKIGERRAIKLAEMKLPEIKPKIRKVPPLEREAVPFIGVLPPQVMHRYLRPDIETVEAFGERFTRDYELERTILRNTLLLFPPQWYALPHGEKIRRYGWDLASAFKHAVTFLHKYSWEDLEQDYGIPKKYIDAWRA
ncbi:MAG: hypothetical protein Q8P40_04890 [Nitrospirota bacterium]|nr:hypothetical protein [Nitrospirota bacterium]